VTGREWHPAHQWRVHRDALARIHARLSDDDRAERADEQDSRGLEQLDREDTQR
jgi:hypothetical protein